MIVERVVGRRTGVIVATAGLRHSPLMPVRAAGAPWHGARACGSTTTHAVAVVAARRPATVVIGAAPIAVAPTTVDPAEVHAASQAVDRTTQLTPAESQSPARRHRAM